MAGSQGLEVKKPKLSLLAVFQVARNKAQTCHELQAAALHHRGLKGCHLKKKALVQNQHV